MKKIITLAIMVTMCSSLLGQIPSSDPHWVLDWHDEFNFFDTTIWIKGHQCDHFEEHQLYLENNVWTADGNLVIRINNTPTQGNNRNYQDRFCKTCTNTLHPYTSGWVESKIPFTKKYGYIEARMKIPHKRGFWPAFWTFRKNGDYQNAGEIDIFEIYGCKSDNHIETNVHLYYDKDGIHDTATMNLMKHDLKNFSYTDWHTYAIEWDRNRIIWYVDQQPIRTMFNHGIVDTVHIILNLATKNNFSCHVRKFPRLEDFMYVDYVRTYTRRNEDDTLIQDYR